MMRRSGLLICCLEQRVPRRAGVPFPYKAPIFSMGLMVFVPHRGGFEPDNDRTFSALPHQVIISGICLYNATVGVSTLSACPSQLNGEPESQA